MSEGHGHGGHAEHGGGHDHGGGESLPLRLFEKMKKRLSVKKLVSTVFNKAVPAGTLRRHVWEFFAGTPHTESHGGGHGGHDDHGGGHGGGGHH